MFSAIGENYSNWTIYSWYFILWSYDFILCYFRWKTRHIQFPFFCFQARIQAVLPGIHGVHSPHRRYLDWVKHTKGICTECATEPRFTVIFQEHHDRVTEHVTSWPSGQFKSLEVPRWNVSRRTSGRHGIVRISRWNTKPGTFWRRSLVRMSRWNVIPRTSGQCSSLRTCVWNV